MEFELTFSQSDTVVFGFKDSECEPIDLSEEEPTMISGEITIDGKKIGELTGYELYNDYDFYSLCDAVSGDCEVIASAICGKRGYVLKKYLTLPGGDFEKIFILDNIKIDKEYRNKGIGSAVLKNLPKMLRYQFGYGSNIFLCASDFESAHNVGFQSETYKNGNKRLINYYKKFGYRVVKNNIMVYNER